MKKKASVFWEEMLLRQNDYIIPKESIVHAWTVHNSLLEIVKKGYKALISSGFYLDKLRPTNAEFPARYGIVDTWADFYQNEPFRNHNWTQREKDLVLGGEACMWGEAVDDGNFFERVWPRVSAVSERLWSPQEINNLNSARIRLERQRCRFVRRGIVIGPVIPANPWSNELLGHCDSIYNFD